MLSSSWLAPFLAWRFIRGTREGSIRLMMQICFLGIALGTFALTLVAAIMNGFEKETHRKLQGINTDIIMRASGKPLDYDKIAQLMQRDYGTIVAATSPQALGHALITPDNSQEMQPAVVGVIGIDPQLQSKTSTLASAVIEPKESSLLSLQQESSVMLGQNLAQALGVSVGDLLSLLFVPDEEPTNNTLTLSRTKVMVSGIFKTGIDEYDANIMLCSLPLFQELFPEVGVTQIGIKLQSHVNPQQALTLLRTRFSSLQLFSWKDLYPAIVEALALEKYAMFLILTLITLVASMSIISLLFMIVTHKRPDIAILTTMGMSHRTLLWVFIFIGVSIAMIAAMVGLTLAALASWLLNTYPIIQLPDVYYVSHIPAELSLSLIISIVILTFALSFLATWLPVQRIRKLNIPTVLKNQG
jgi:lipoprotein-releasing system permease protein